MNKKLTTIFTVIAIFAGFSMINGDSKGNPGTGGAIYNQKCSACHEPAQPGANSKLAPSIKSPFFLNLADDALITSILKKGRAGTSMTPMPSGLQDSEIPHVIAYLRSLPVSEPIKMKLSKIKVDYSKKVSGNSSDGEKKFQKYCEQCHGMKGEGISGNGPGIGRAGFLETMPDDFILQTVKFGRPGTSMRGFNKAAGLANLEDKDIMDIISYLRSLK